MIVRVDPPEGLHLFAIGIEACTFLGPFIDGTSGLYDCPLTDILEVQLAAPLPGNPAVDTIYGIVVPRSLDPSNLPLFPFLEVGTYAANLDDARARTIVPDITSPLPPDEAVEAPAIDPDSEAEVDGRGRRFRLGPDGRILYVDLGAPIRSLFPRRRASPAAAEGPVDPAQPPPEPALAETVVHWPAPLGALVAQGAEGLRPLDAVGAINLAALTYDPARAEAGEVVLALTRNPACNTVFVPPPSDAPVTVSLTFDCRMVEVTTTGIPGAAQAACEALADGSTLRCLIVGNPETLVISTPTWGDLALPLGGAAPGQPVSLGDAATGQMAPLPRLDPAILTAAPGESCADFRAEVRFSGYCGTQDPASCRPAPPGTPIGGDGRLPTLQAAGWGNGLPGHARLQLIINGTVSVDGVAPLNRGGLLGFETAAAAGRHPPALPLTLDIADDQFGNGRSVQFFGDQACTGAPTGTLDLALRGLGRASARVCGGLRVFNQGQPASTCTPVALAPDGATLRATLPRDACAASRVVLAVIQNSSLNGSASRATSEALSQVIAATRRANGCVPLDLATTQSERRDVIARAEGLFFGGSDPALDAIDAMSYVNPASQLLRDLGWIYRTWGPQLGALILVADGAGTFVSDITDSPEAMAWQIRGVPVTLIDPSGRDNCATFQNQLFFDTCLPVTPDSLPETIIGEVARGVRALR